MRELRLYNFTSHALMCQLLMWRYWLYNWFKIRRSFKYRKKSYHKKNKNEPCPSRMPSPDVKNFSRWARFPCSMEATLRPSTAPSERELFHSQKLIPISSRVRVILRTVECYNFKSYLFFSTKLFIESTWRWNSNLRLELFYRNKHAARQVLLFGLVPDNFIKWTICTWK